MAESEFVIREFDLSTMRKCMTAIIIGNSKSGKTTLIKYLIAKKYADLPFGIIVTPTDKSQYEGMVPNKLIHEIYSDDIASTIFRRQHIIRKAWTNEECRLGTGNSKINRDLYLVLDNCMNDMSRSKNGILYCLLGNTRTLRITVFLAITHALAIPWSIRSNFEYIFIFAESDPQNRKRLYEQYARMFPTFEHFCQVLDANTSDYKCLVIDNESRSNRIEDCVFYYRFVSNYFTPFRGVKE